MSFLEKMQKRYTTKKYDANFKLNDSTIEELEKIIQLSPSSINSQPWKFIFIDDQKLKEELAPFSEHNVDKVRDCSHLVIFNAVHNLDMLEEQIRINNPAYQLTSFQNKRKNFSQQQIQCWIEKQVYIALGILLAACAQMNIDATPMEGIESEKYTQILKLKNYHALVAVALGKRDPEDYNQLKFRAKKRIDSVEERN